VKRREFIKWSGLIAGSSLISAYELQAQEPLSEDNPQARALGYVEQSEAAARHCTNCLQATGDLSAEWVGCKIFPGKLVKGAGWCKVWSPRPA